MLFIMPFSAVSAVLGEDEKTGRASMGFGLVGAEGTAENSGGHRGGHCADDRTPSATTRCPVLLQSI